VLTDETIDEGEPMMKKVFSSVVFLLAMAAVSAAAQEVVVTGPPPALRKNMDAFRAAVNGTPAEYEAMAKTVFTDEFYKSQTPAQRKADLEKMRAAFGTIAFGRVERNGGPDAPLQVSVKGSVGEGVLWIGLDDDTSKFMSIKPEFPKK
jgi:hypothetical protein